MEAVGAAGVCAGAFAAHGCGCGVVMVGGGMEGQMRCGWCGVIGFGRMSGRFCLQTLLSVLSIAFNSVTKVLGLYQARRAIRDLGAMPFGVTFFLVLLSHPTRQVP